MPVKIYIIVAAVMSVVTFLLYAIDKRNAKAGEWRISEKALLLCSLFFGAAGGSLAMAVCRHKTRHWYFIAVNALSLAVHVVGLVLVYNVK